MTKRIAILQNGLIRGGTERFVINLCRGLLEQQSKYEITVVNPSLIAEQQVLEPEVLATGARIEHTTTIVGIGGRLKHLWMLYKLLRRGHYDVFHTNLDLFNGPNLLIAWLARVPIRICHAHASMQETEIRGGRTIAIRVYQHFMRWMCWTFANRHIGCSDEANDFLYQGHDWRKANYPTVIYNGIDLDKYRRDKSSNGSMQQSCGSNGSMQQGCGLGSSSNINSEALSFLGQLSGAQALKQENNFNYGTGIRRFSNISDGTETLQTGVRDNSTGGVQIRQSLCAADSICSRISDGQYSGGFRTPGQQRVQELPIHCQGLMWGTQEPTDESSRCRLYNGRDIHSDVCRQQETLNSNSQLYQKSEKLRLQGESLSVESKQHSCESSSLSNLNSEALNPLNGLQSIEPLEHSEALELAKPLNPASAFEPIYILAIGRFVTQKNPYFILDIMVQLQEMQANIKLLWVGDGELYKDIESEIYDRKIDNIALLGWRDDIPALMQRSNLLLMPSLFEGLSITLIEAQAAGLPCLVSDTVTKQAQCGLIKYKSLDDGAESWAQEIISLLELLEPSEAFEPLELSEALSLFSIEYMAKQFEQVVQSYSLPKR